MANRSVSRRGLLAAGATGSLVATVGCVGWFGRGSDRTGAVDRHWVSDTRTGYAQNHHGLEVLDHPEGTFIGAPLNDHLEGGTCSVVGVDDTGRVRWREPLPAARCNVHALGDVGVGDVTGSGTPDLLVPHETGTVVGHRVTDGEVVFEAEMVDWGYAAPTVIAESDGSNAIVVVGNEGAVALAGADGERRWQRQLAGSVWSPVAVGAFTEPNTTEIAVNLGHGSGEIVILGVDGSIRRRVTIPRFSISWTVLPTTETADILLAERDNVLRRVDLSEPRERWSVTLPDDFVDVGSVADGLVYVGDQAGTVRALALDDGTTRWQRSTGDDRVYGPVIGDPVANGPEAVVTVSGGGRAVAMEVETGDVLVDAPVASGTYTSPTMTDLTDDGTDDLIVFHGDGRIGAYGLSRAANGP